MSKDLETDLRNQLAGLCNQLSALTCEHGWSYDVGQRKIVLISHDLSMLKKIEGMLKYVGLLPVIGKLPSFINQLDKFTIVLNFPSEIPAKIQSVSIENRHAQLNV